MTLYHFTSLDALRSIIRDGFIDVSSAASESLLSMEEELSAVWFTADPDFSRAAQWMPGGSLSDRTQAAIVIQNAGFDNFDYWYTWARQKGMSRKQIQSFIDRTEQWRTWYISEQPVPIDENADVILRPDIMKKVWDVDFDLKKLDSALEKLKTIFDLEAEDPGHLGLWQFSSDVKGRNT